MTQHPRDRFDLQPSAEAEARFEDARLRGRLHHAWLLTGPQGVGKATFAYRAARRLLGARPDPQRGLLGTRPDDPVARLVSAMSHPDLLVLERLIEKDRLKKTISVDQARDLPDFFSKSPSLAKARVAIVDAADDLNANAANALLKILEEPPQHGVLFLISHAPGRLLPTIRSRCRRLAFAPWSAAALTDLVMDRLSVSAEAARNVAQMANGSPGAALDLASGPVMEADRLARSWIAGPADRAEQLAYAETLAGAEGQARFDMIMDRLIAAVRTESIERSRTRSGEGARWAELWTRLSELPSRAAGLNLDRGDVLTGALGEIARLRSAGA